MIPDSIERELRSLPTQALDPKKVAVLLNRNARRVTDRVYKRMCAIAGRDNVFYSKNLEEAEAFAREIVQRGYGTVATGGGDGTLCRSVNLVANYVNEANQFRVERFRNRGEFQARLPLPRFAPLKLGTGNGLREVVGSTDAVKDLKSIVNFLPGRTHEIPMISVDDELCFFGGLGYDSLVLNDYNLIKQATKNPLMKPFMHTVGGYFVALLLRTLPNLMFNNDLKLELRITTRAPAYYVDPRRGDRSEEIPANTVLFEGPARMVAAGTTPFYGYGLRVFPFAGIMPGAMNLRVATMGPMSAVLNLPSIWRGHYRNHDTIQDFLATDIEIELSKPFPFQQAGDPQGLRDHVRMQVSKSSVELVDFYQHRLMG